MSDVRKLASIASINHAAMVADGLELIASEIRAGKFSVPVRRCLLIVSGPDGMTMDGVGLIHFGADTSLAETVGLLEIAKIEAIDAA